MRKNLAHGNTAGLEGHVNSKDGPVSSRHCPKGESESLKLSPLGHTTTLRDAGPFASHSSRARKIHQRLQPPSPVGFRDPLMHRPSTCVGTIVDGPSVSSNPHDARLLLPTICNTLRIGTDLNVHHRQSARPLMVPIKRIEQLRETSPRSCDQLC